MVRECCEQDDKLEALELRLERLECKMDRLDTLTIEIDKRQALSDEKIIQIFGLLEKMTSSIEKIEHTISTLAQKEDPFQRAIYDVGMWSVKVLVCGGAIAWLAANFG